MYTVRRGGILIALTYLAPKTLNNTKKLERVKYSNLIIGEICVYWYCKFIYCTARWCVDSICGFCTQELKTIFLSGNSRCNTILNLKMINVYTVRRGGILIPLTFLVQKTLNNTKRLKRKLLDKNMYTVGRAMVY